MLTHPTRAADEDQAHLRYSSDAAVLRPLHEHDELTGHGHQTRVLPSLQSGQGLRRRKFILYGNASAGVEPHQHAKQKQGVRDASGCQDAQAMVHAKRVGTHAKAFYPRAMVPLKPFGYAGAARGKANVKRVGVARRVLRGVFRQCFAATGFVTQSLSHRTTNVIGPIGITHGGAAASLHNA